jgi:glycosyltransferase involved in cell wall biosynthesis
LPIDARDGANAVRIAVNAAIVDAALSGLGVYTANLVRELAQIHADVVVYTSAPDVCGVNSARVRRISRALQPQRGGRAHLRRIAWAQVNLPLRLLADRASVLLSPVPEGTLFSPLPQVMVVHDLIPLHLPGSFPRQYLYFRHVVPRILRASRAVVTDSESTKRDVVRFYGIDPTRVSVVPCGYDRARFHVGIDPSAVMHKHGLGPYVLFVGNLFPHKNLPVLLEAFQLLTKRFPHSLVIAGKKDPRYYPSLAARASALREPGRVRFLDYVPAEDLPALYAGAAALVLPSLYEGFGLPVLEAMACGTPVIASRAGSIPEAAGDGALLVEPSDVRALAAAIQTVLDDPGEREGLRRRGFAQVVRFGWERTALEMLEVLREAVQGGSQVPLAGGRESRRGIIEAGKLDGLDVIGCGTDPRER